MDVFSEIRCSITTQIKWEAAFAICQQAANAADFEIKKVDWLTGRILAHYRSEQGITEAKITIHLPPGDHLVLVRSDSPVEAESEPASTVSELERLIQKTENEFNTSRFRIQLSRLLEELTEPDDELSAVAGADRSAKQEFSSIGNPTPAGSTMPTFRRRQLRQNLDAHFSLSELKDLCFDLHIDHEREKDEGKSGLIRVIIAGSERRGREKELLAYLRETRPDVDW